MARQGLNLNLSLSNGLSALAALVENHCANIKTQDINHKKGFKKIFKKSF